MMSSQRKPMRRSSEIITPLTSSLESNGGGQHRRHSSWSLEDLQEEQSDDESATMAEQLTGQRWHEVGNGPYPLGASSDFDVMVDQLSSILAMRMKDLLIYWMGGGEAGRRRSPSSSFASKNDTMAMAMEYLRLDGQIGDYVLVDSLRDSIREYVKCIGKLYNRVGFHSFEHASHVTISMNKLLSMVSVNTNFRSYMKRRISEHNIGSIHPHDNGQGGVENFSFGIGEDPRILFAMVFSALIHDVGHTGVPNSVLVDEEDDLAILHNDVSVAEQNSLQVAFSMLQRDEFAGLKKCICPTPEERKFFRKKVISMVMVTDISDQERVQIVASRWNAAFPSGDVEGGGKGGGDDKNAQKNGSNGQAGTGNKLPSPPRHRKSEIQSQEIRENIRRRRFTMFSSDAAVEEFANEQRSRRLGIRTSMDFSGMLLDAYRTMDQLQQHAVLETMMNVADVSHTMQSFQVFVKWNRRLFKEFYAAHLSGRLSFDPTENWYENQIGFFSHYIIPLSRKMKICGVFGTTGTVFEYFATENRKRWIEEGETISMEIIRDATEEVEREQGAKAMVNGCHK